MYIYDPQLTASRGLGAENAALYGLGKRPEVALPATPSEVQRLTGEITRLVQEGMWSGAERTYKSLEDISKRMGDETFDLLPNAVAIHRAGAQTSLTFGNTQFYQRRLMRELRSRDNTGEDVKTPEYKVCIDSLHAIDEVYGAVNIVPWSEPTSKRQIAKLKDHGPELTRVEQPGKPLLIPDQLRSIEFAKQEIKKDGKFDGLLPAGDYKLKLADLSVTEFTVDAGTELKSKPRKDVPWGK